MLMVNEFTYLADIIKLRGKYHTININLIGSRLSGKTISILIFLYYLGYNADNLKVKTDFWRLEPKGALESFIEALSLYDLDQKWLVNNTFKRIKLPNNNISFRGYKSNTKKKVAKLGIARQGVGKDVQVNIFEECTEFDDQKTIEVIKQASGGAKFTINIYIANPWLITMWYVKYFNENLPFNRRLLQTKGQQFTNKIDGKTLNLFHISNHRVNNFLSEGQHQSLIDTKKMDKQLWEVADLGLPGVATGLVYAPVLNKAKDNSMFKGRPTPFEFVGGLDLGTATGTNGSDTALELGYFTENYKGVEIDDEYYHSNNSNYYLSDDKIVDGIVDKVEEYVRANLGAIRRTRKQVLTIYYDYAELFIKGHLERVINLRGNLKQFVRIKTCVKFEVPVRITAVKDLINSGNFGINKKKCKKLHEQLANCMYDETKNVKGLPTRQKINDHSLDAMDYLISHKMSKISRQGRLRVDKRYKRSFNL